MSDRIARNASKIKSLQRMNCTNRKSYLKHCDREFIDSICECTKNLLAGNVPVTSKQYKKLKPYKKVLRKLSNKKLTNEHRRQLLVKQKGGFLPALLAPLVGLASSLIGGLIGGR
jgi:hypothetical protein